MVINMVKHTGHVHAIIILISISGKAQHEQIFRNKLEYG